MTKLRFHFQILLATWFTTLVGLAAFAMFWSLPITGTFVAEQAPGQSYSGSGSGSYYDDSNGFTLNDIDIAYTGNSGQFRDEARNISEDTLDDLIAGTFSAEQLPGQSYSGYSGSGYSGSGSRSGSGSYYDDSNGFTLNDIDIAYAGDSGQSGDEAGNISKDTLDDLIV